MLTIPSEVGEVQRDLGLSKKGSFVLSLKNPESSGPANAQLPQGADYPKDIMDEFRGRNWMPAEPKHVNYAMAQVLLIGEDFDSSSNLDPAPKDEKNGEKETPQEELEKLEGEDEHRVERLRGVSVFPFSERSNTNHHGQAMTPCLQIWASQAKTIPKYPPHGSTPSCESFRIQCLEVFSHPGGPRSSQWTRGSGDARPLRGRCEDFLLMYHSQDRPVVRDYKYKSASQPYVASKELYSRACRRWSHQDPPSFHLPSPT